MARKGVADGKGTRGREGGGRRTETFWVDMMIAGTLITKVTAKLISRLVRAERTLSNLKRANPRSMTGCMSAVMPVCGICIVYSCDCA